MKYVILRATFKAHDEIQFPPNPANTIRGALGYRLKKHMCFQKARRDPYCRGCIAETHCLYAASFETGQQHVVSVSASGKKIDIPHLMVFSAKFSGPAHFMPDSQFSFEIHLFGKAVDAVPWVVLGLASVGESGLTRSRTLCDLVSVTDSETGACIFDQREEVVRAWAPHELHLAGPDLADTGEYRIRLHFETPICFKDRASGRAVPEVAFSRIIGSLLRRYTAFTVASGAPPPDWDFANIMRVAKSVEIEQHNLRFQPWERFSTRQKQRIKHGGLTGSATYRGQLHPFIPLLEAAEIIRVGRGTTFGQGAVTLAACRTNLIEVQGSDFEAGFCLI